MSSCIKVRFISSDCRYSCPTFTNVGFHAKIVSFFPAVDLSFLSVNCLTARRCHLIRLASVEDESACRCDVVSGNLVPMPLGRTRIPTKSSRNKPGPPRWETIDIVRAVALPLWLGRRNIHERQRIKCILEKLKCPDVWTA
jgi:hypothetical protein